MFTFYAYSEVYYSFSFGTIFYSIPVMWMCDPLHPFGHWLITTELWQLSSTWLISEAWPSFPICYLLIKLMNLYSVRYLLYILRLIFSIYLMDSNIWKCNPITKCCTKLYGFYLFLLVKAQCFSSLQHVNKHYPLTIIIGLENNSTLSAINWWTVAKFNVN